MNLSIAETSVLPPEAELPHLVVLGAGNTVHGLESGSVTNATFAAQLILNRTAPDDYMITAGYGPHKDVRYPAPESKGMKRVIQDMIEPEGFTTLILTESQSLDTIGNLEGIAPMVEKIGIEALGFVAAKGHAERACTMARRILGKGIEAVPVVSTHDVSGKNRVKEAGLRTLYGALTIGSSADLSARHTAYRGVVRLPKRAVGHLSSRYA